MSRGPGQLRIGTCSWKYPSWAGLVYSAPKGIDYLAEYARRYDTVEVDQWFWSLFGPDRVVLPREADVAAYRRAVPEHFRFTIKAPNSLTLTHYHSKAKTEPLVPNPYWLSPDLARAFLALLAPLYDVLGPVMFQFEYMNRQKMASSARFLEQLAAFSEGLPPGTTYGVEVRNPNYINAAYFEALQRLRLAPVLLQGYWMTPVADVYRHWRRLLIEQETIVVRLHGPDRERVESETGGQWDRIVAPRDDELATIADVVLDLLNEGVTVYLNVNNHYEGSAPLTIERLRRLLGE